MDPFTNYYETEFNKIMFPEAATEDEEALPKEVIAGKKAAQVAELLVSLGRHKESVTYFQTFLKKLTPYKDTVVWESYFWSINGYFVFCISISSSRFMICF